MCERESGVGESAMAEIECVRVSFCLSEREREVI